MAISTAASTTLPGDHLTAISVHAKHNAPNPTLGHGLHVSSGNVYATQIGTLHKDPKDITIESPTVSTKLPYVNATVLARVTRVTTRQAHVAILAVDDTPCTTYADDPGFGGLIRVQDVRATEKDKVVVAESFSVGDIIRAVVISIGDERSYYLSTAQNELGVVMAKGADSGAPMFPLNWKEVVDSLTGKREARKVARPDV